MSIFFSLVGTDWILKNIETILGYLPENLDFSKETVLNGILQLYIDRVALWETVQPI